MAVAAAIAAWAWWAVAFEWAGRSSLRADDARANQPHTTANATYSASQDDGATAKTETRLPAAGLLLPVDGPAQPAELRAADKQWRWHFAVAQGSATLNAAEVVQWGQPVEPSAGPLVVLADGSLLVAEPLDTENETLRFDSDLFGQQRLPLECLAGLVFNPPVDRLQRDLLLDRLVYAPGQSDVAVLVNGDELSGVLEAVSEQQVVFRAELGPLKLDRSRVAAVVFNPALRRNVKRPPFCVLVGFSDGTRVLAANMELVDQRLQVTVPAGAAFSTDAKHLAGLIPLGGRTVYLSDVEPLEYQHTPFLELKWPFRTDRNVLGGMLRSAGQWYPKGLGVHSAARLVYGLDGSYRRFEAELAIDDCAGRQGSVVFRVLLDGKQKLASPVIRGGQRPVPVSVPLDDAQRLELVVDYADRADVLDRANWLRARLIK